MRRGCISSKKRAESAKLDAVAAANPEEMEYGV